MNGIQKQDSTKRVREVNGMKRVSVRALPDGNAYLVEANDYHTLDTVWLSQKCWFSQGESVEITDENGESEIYTKE